MPFGSLWLPVLVSAAVVWIGGAIAWTALPHHKSDYKELPSEDGVSEALRKLGLTPGQYLLPWMGDREKMKDPAFLKRMEEGPVAMINSRPSGMPGMGKNLALHFGYCVLVSFVTAYVARHTLNAGTARGDVFHITGSVAIAAYALASLPESIWFWRPWPVTLKNLADAIVFGLLTGAVFAWLWPHG
jgi:hypothetical protein